MLKINPYLSLLVVEIKAQRKNKNKIKKEKEIL